MKILKKITKKLNRRVFSSKGSRYFKFKYFSILIGCIVLVFISNIEKANALTLGRVSTTSNQYWQSNLIAWYTFDGADLISNLVDKSGQSHTGLLKNISATTSSIVPGKIGQAMQFDGVDDYVDAGASDWLGTGDLTISAWIYPKSSGENANGSIIENRKLVFGMYDTAGANTIVISSDADATYAKSANGSVPYNKWTHVIATRSSSGVANLYVNGVLSGSANQNSGTPAAGSLGVQIGNTIITSRTWDGYIDDLKVFNKVLSASEAKFLYSQGLAETNVPITRNTTDNLSNGLVGHWTFDGKNLINNVTDSSGNGNTGILQNFPATSSVVVQGKVGQALTFNNDYVSINESTSLRTTNMTISFWMKSLGTNLEYLLFKDKASNVSYYIQNNNSANIKFCTTGGTCLSASNSGYLNNWVHVAITFDGSTGKFYKNGTFDTQQTSMNAIDYTSPNKLYIGYSSNAPQAVMDDVRIYNRVLSANEIAQIYNQNSSKLASVASKPPLSSLTSGLVGHWSFDGKYLTNNVTDLSGNGNTGYLMNMTTTTAVTAGKIGQALNFDGINDYIRIAPSSTLNDMGPLTYAAWVYLPVAPGSENDLIGKRRRLFYLTNLLAPATVLFFTSNDTTNTSVRSNTAIALNKWTHVAVVWNGQIGAGLSCDFYINGALTSKTTFNTGSNNVISDTAFDMTVGAYADGASGFVNGKIDDVRVYNRMLSANEIYQLYTMGR